LLKNFLITKNYIIEDVERILINRVIIPILHLKLPKSSYKQSRFWNCFDATGIPSAITANKLPGIRAATVIMSFSARSSREHNNANIIVLGAKMLGDELIKSILDVWLTSSFLGERHQKRLDKISKIEEHFLNKTL
jgi:ribose 5-phosphate isomerase B